MSKYTIYRDHGNNLFVLDGACNIVYPAPTVARGSCVLSHRVTTDLNNPPSETNPWLCELASGQVALFTSDWLPPVWVSEGNPRSYQAWGIFPWAPHSEAPAPGVMVGEKWEAWNGQIYEVIGEYAAGRVGVRQLGAGLDCAARAEALKRKVGEAAPDAPDADVYLRAEFEKRHPGLFLVREGEQYADSRTRSLWLAWITAIDAARAATGKSDRIKELEDKHAAATAELADAREWAQAREARIQELVYVVTRSRDAKESLHRDIAVKDARIKELESEETKWRAINQSNNELRTGYCNWLAEIADALDAPSGNIGFIRDGLKAWKDRVKELESTLATKEQIEANLRGCIRNADTKREALEQARNNLLAENQKLRNAAAAAQDFSGLEARALAFCVSGSSTDWITSIPTGRITGAPPALAAPYSSKDFTIAQLKGEVANLRAQAEKDQSTISSLHGQVRSKSDRIKELEAKVKELEALVGDKPARLNQLNERRQKLDKALSDALGLLRGTRD